MRATVTALVAALAAAAVLASGGRFKHLHRLRGDGDQAAIRCLLSDANDGCTEALTELKGNLHIVASSNCGVCTEDERENVIGYFKDLFIRNPKWAQKIQDKYDPTGEFRRKHGAVWRKKGIPVYDLATV
uniref:Chemosensory protein 3 n=1 Tax=Oedaleus infernalis TaxID=267432 RepID=A0A3G2LGF1_9ORTH|nr:chemosensory protein 3 [Oedaleus infernalis]